MPKISGICSQQFIRSHFFRHEHRGKQIKIIKKHCPRKAVFLKRCRKHNLTGLKLRFCMRDLCNGLPRRIERIILKKK